MMLRAAGAPQTRQSPATVGTVPYPPGMDVEIPAGHAAAATVDAEPGMTGAGDAPATADPGPGHSLSPSRAGDFLTCPLLYRFRVIDRLPEPPSPAAARGTLVHAVLERLFDRPAPGRTPEAARSLLGPEWDRLTAQ